MKEINDKMTKCLLWKTTRFVAVHFDELCVIYMGTLIRNVIKNLFKVTNKIIRTTPTNYSSAFNDDCK